MAADENSMLRFPLETWFALVHVRKKRDQHSQLIFAKQHFVGPFPLATPHLTVEGKFEFEVGGLLAAPARCKGFCCQKCRAAGALQIRSCYEKHHDVRPRIALYPE